MKNVWMVTLALGIIVLAIPASALSEGMSLELNANSSDVEGKFESKVLRYQADLYAATGVLYSNGDYILGNLNASMRDTVFTPALTLGLGLKGVAGSVDFPGKDYEVYALGFMFRGAYDFRDDRTEWPFSIVYGFTWAPSPLSFGDTDRYIDSDLTVHVHVVDSAAILIGYRFFDVRFSTDVERQKKNDDAVYFGLKMYF